MNTGFWNKFTVREWVTLGSIVAILVAVAWVGIFLWYNATHIFVTNSRPTNNSTASSATDVVFWFNKEVSPDSAKNISISPKVDGKASVNGNSLTFSPDTTLNEDQTYTVTVSSVQSADKKFTSGVIKLAFKIGFVPYDKLPKEVQERGLKFTDDQPPQIAYFGEDDLVDQGVTLKQISYIEAALKKIFDSTPKTDYAINIDNVASAPFDSNSDNPKNTLTFTVDINDHIYTVTLDSYVSGDMSMKVANKAGKVIQNTGLIKLGD